MTRARTRLLLAMCGEAHPEVQAEGGNYDDWFARHFDDDVELCRRQVWAGERLADDPSFDGIVLSGSSFSVLDGQPWMLALAEDLREAIARDRPVLGVCFGHQLLAHAFGGRVERHPRGREIGTVEVELTAEGRRSPLFAELADGVPRLRFNTTHGDHVAELPPDAVCLAANTHSPVQAFAVGRRAVGVQFHPELDARTTGAMIRVRERELASEMRARGEDPERGLEALRSHLHDVATGRTLLRGFVRRVREGW